MRLVQAEKKTCRCDKGVQPALPVALDAGVSSSRDKVVYKVALTHVSTWKW